MKLLLLLISTIYSITVYSQTSGQITYTSTIKLELDLPEGLDISGMLSDQLSHDNVLSFNGPESVYTDHKDNVDQEKEITSDDGSFKMVFKLDAPEEKLYTNLSTKEQYRQTGFMGKTFLIENSIEKNKWKLTGEKIKYLGYVCQKAERTEYVEREDKERMIVAWFTSEIPVPIGPDVYNNLPGAVLMVNIDNGKTEIKATAVDLKPIEDKALEKPTKGQKVTKEEFDQIVEQKTREMEEEYGGEGSIILRG